MSNAHTLGQTLLQFSSDSPLLARLILASVEVAVLAAAVYLLTRLPRLASPRFRAALWLLVLAKGIFSVGAGSPLPLYLLEAPAAREAPVAAAAIVDLDQAARNRLEEERALAALAEAERMDAEAAAAAPGDGTAAAQRAAAGRGSGDAASRPGIVARAASGLAASAASASRAAWRGFWSPAGARAVAGLWIVGVGLMLLLTLRDFVRIARLRRAATEPSPEILRHYLEQARLWLDKQSQAQQSGAGFPACAPLGDERTRTKRSGAGFPAYAPRAADATGDGRKGLPTSGPFQASFPSGETATKAGWKACPTSLLASSWRRLCEWLSPRRPPRLLVSDAVCSPALVGVFRPVVLLPTWLVDSAPDPRRIAWLLRHELMHWRLRDTLGLAVRRAAEILLYFHPAVWWAGRRWEEAMELACDRALLRTDADARDYAEQLYGVLQAHAAASRPAVVRAGLCATRTQIGKRIAALLTNPLATPARLSPSSATLLVLLTVAALSCGVGVDQSEQGKAKAKKDADKGQTAVVTPLASPTAEERLPKADFPDPLDRRLLDHIPMGYQYQKPLVEALLDLQEKENRPNALLYYVAATFVMPANPGETQKDLIASVTASGWSAEAESLKPYLELSQPAFTLIRKGASLDYARGFGLFLEGAPTPVPNFLGIQLAARSLCVEAHYFESQGKLHDALENHLAGLTMGRDLMSPDNPLFSPLIGIAVANIMMNRMPLLLANEKLSAADLERCRARLETLDKSWPGLGDAFRLEGQGVQRMVSRMRKDGNAEALITEWSRQGVSLEWLEPGRVERYRKAAKNLNRVEAEQKKGWDLLQRYAETPWWNQDRDNYQVEIMQFENKSLFPIPSVLEASVRWNVAKARLGLVRMATGLEIYKAATGKYAASLEELTSAQVGEEPVTDPFSGRPLGYRLDADRYTLWSIGPDGKDNAGALAYDPTNGTVSRGNIVLTVPPLAPALAPGNPAVPLPAAAPAASPTLDTVGISRPAPAQEPAGAKAPQPASAVQERLSKVQADLRSLATAMEAYCVDYYNYPSSLPALTTPVAYITSIPQDPFSRQNPPETYRLNVDTADQHPVIYSVGPDGVDQKGLVVYDPAQGDNGAGDIVRKLQSTYYVQGIDEALAAKIGKQQAALSGMERLVQLWYATASREARGNEKTVGLTDNVAAVGLPDSLEPVVSKTGIVKGVPEDLFVPGRKLSYRLSPDKQTAWVYSLGPDGVDDGGNRPIAGNIGLGQIPKGDIFVEVSLDRLRDQNPEISEPLDRRLLEHIPERADFQKPMVEALLDLQDQDKRPNALLYYVAASFLAPGNVDVAENDLIKSVLASGWTDSAASLKINLALWQPAFGLIRQGVALDYAKGIGFQGPQTPVPNFLQAQLSAKALCVEGRYFESQGKYHEALDNYFTVLTVGRDYQSSENTFSSHLIGIALTRIATGQIGRLVTAGQLAPGDLGRARARLESLEKTVPPIVEGLRFESLTHVWLVEDTRAKLKQAASGEIPTTTVDPKASAAEIAKLKAQVVDVDRLEADRKKIWDFILRDAETPWWLLNPAEAKVELKRLVDQSQPLLRTAIPDFSDALARWNVANAGLHLARMTTGLELFKAANGKYPVSLDALTPVQLGDEPTIDPFSGNPLLYRLDGDRTTLWSVGPDSKDDGGAVVYDPSNGTVSAGDVLLGERAR